MRDLGDQIRSYVDDVAPPITLGDLADRPGPILETSPRTEHRSPARRVVLAVAACLVVTVGLVAVARARGSGGDDRVAAGPTTAPPAAEDLGWLTPFGQEPPPPAMPAGWKVLDFADMRFAVPANWATPVSRSCAPVSVGVVLVSDGSPGQTTCGPAQPLPVSTLVIEPISGPAETGTPAKVGAFAAKKVTPPACDTCGDTFQLDNGYQVTTTGPDADQVRATFTDSGAHRVLQTGPLADTTGWHPLTFGAVSFQVPAAWPTEQLSTADPNVTTIGGTTLRQSGEVNPGVCGNALFREPATVYLGSSPMSPSCPLGMIKDLVPRDGAWIRVLDDQMKPSTSRPITQGRLNGLSVTVVDTDRTADRAPSPVLDIEITDGSQTLWLTLGVGLDPSAARAILRSLHRAGPQLDPPPSAGPTITPVGSAPTAPTNGTDGAAVQTYTVELVYLQPPCWNSWRAQAATSSAWEPVDSTKDIPLDWAPGPVKGTLTVTSDRAASFTARGITIEMQGGLNAKFSQPCLLAPTR